jgi:iron complex outermembrane recepter protein
VEARYGGAEREKSVGGLIEVGNGRFALHADAHTRDTDDLRIPGYARSSRLRAEDPRTGEAHGTLPNSASRAHGGAIGGSVTWDRGYAGLSYSALDKKYGTVAEPDVTIDMQSRRFDLAGEVRDIAAAISGARFKLGRVDYEHRELDLGVPATTFRNKGYEARIEAQHAPRAAARGGRRTGHAFRFFGAGSGSIRAVYGDRRSRSVRVRGARVDAGSEAHARRAS